MHASSIMSPLSPWSTLASVRFACSVVVLRLRPLAPQGPGVVHRAWTGDSAPTRWTLMKTCCNSEHDDDASPSGTHRPLGTILGRSHFDMELYGYMPRPGFQRGTPSRTDTADSSIDYDYTMVCITVHWR